MVRAFEKKKPLLSVQKCVHGILLSFLLFCADQHVCSLACSLVTTDFMCLQSRKKYAQQKKRGEENPSDEVCLVICHSYFFL